MNAARSERFGDRQAVRHGSMRVLARLAGARRNIRRKPRSAEQQAMLRAMAMGAVSQQLESGRLQRVGPREYVLRVGRDHPSTSDSAER